jgi:hypothetical protein
MNGSRITAGMGRIRKDAYTLKSVCIVFEKELHSTNALEGYT